MSRDVAASVDKPATYGLCQLANRIRLSPAEIKRAYDLGLLPLAEVNGRRWTRPQVERIECRVEVIRRGLVHPVESAVSWARTMLAPGRAVILDTETTAMIGAIVEIAVIDAATGTVLLDTLVNPGCAIKASARAVHGISDDEVAGAQRWGAVFPLLREVTAGRQILCYNAPFDYETVQRDTIRAHLQPGSLADGDRWECVMRRRTASLGARRWLPLGGEHRALGDVHAARAIMMKMAKSAIPDQLCYWAL